MLELFERSIAIELLSLSFIHIHSTSVARRFEDILATVRSWEGTEVSNKVPRYRGVADESSRHTGMLHSNKLLDMGEHVA